MKPQVIDHKDTWEEIMERNESFFLLKHSLTCPISAAANNQFERFVDQTDVPCYVLYVQKSRELSNYIAETYQVRHESPQALYFKNGQVVWHDSHNAITSERLKKTSE
ncbi:bacillithiol system redox-active protein YtxJ [Halobacillus litoralis]|uniref:bacillithiol system redox-active protein YtxJ n=1 Tax=Halobacillus litoralis TaxID=45668 RepID=UPI001CFC6CB0|nr:bacillithiol system redox-active protein YtxJ [Halobacillus litoralis]